MRLFPGGRACNPKCKPGYVVFVMEVTSLRTFVKDVVE